MVDKVVELENGRMYVILDKTYLDNKTYYLGVRLDDNNNITDNYVIFLENVDCRDTYLIKIDKDNMKGELLTSFTVDLLSKVYDSE